MEPMSTHSTLPTSPMTRLPALSAEIANGELYWPGPTPSTPNDSQLVPFESKRRPKTPSLLPSRLLSCQITTKFPDESLATDEAPRSPFV